MVFLIDPSAPKLSKCTDKGCGRNVIPLYGICADFGPQ